MHFLLQAIHSPPPPLPKRIFTKLFRGTTLCIRDKNFFNNFNKSLYSHRLSHKCRGEGSFNEEKNSPSDDTECYLEKQRMVEAIR